MHRLQDTHDEEGERARREDRAEYFVPVEVRYTGRYVTTIKAEAIDDN